MKRGFQITFVFALFLVLSVGFVSAGFVSDALGKIANNINDHSREIQFSPPIHEVIPPRDGAGSSVVFADVTVKPGRVIIMKEGGKYDLRVNGKRACVNYNSQGYCAIQGESVSIENVGEVKFEKVRSSKSLFRNKGAVKFRIISTSD